MDTRTDYLTPVKRNSPILAHDSDGQEHFLIVVDHPVGLISIADNEMVRTMSPPAAAVLVQQLHRAIGRTLGLRRRRTIQQPVLKGEG